jgi:TPR repeat protein
LALGHYEQAETWLRYAMSGDIDVTSTSELAATYLATVYIRQGETDAARKILDAAARMSGPARDVRALLELDGALLRDRAERGHLPAMKALRRLAELRGDVDECYRWLVREAAFGDHETLLKAARQADGRSDVDSARQWLTTAAEGGEPEAAARLAMLEETSGSPAGVTRWRETERRLRRALVELRAGERAQSIGDVASALSHWRAAADAGSVRAASCLAYVLLRNDESDPEALRWARCAADSGDSPSAVSLAAIREVAGDLDEARKYRELAAILVRNR